MNAVSEEVSQDALQRKSVLTSKPSSKSEKSYIPDITAKVRATTSKVHFEDIKLEVARSTTAKTEEKQQELLRQQYCNFRDFEHTVEKTCLETIIEKWELADALKILTNKWKSIEKIDWELDYILQDDYSTYKQKYEVLENVYDNLRKELKDKIWNDSYYQQSKPKIIIPDFYGNYDQWLTFKDIFIESVHNNALLSTAQKMHYLKSKMKGEAKKLVQHLEISSENYISCWETITHRFDNGRLLFTSYMNTLLNQPTVQLASAANIRKLHDVTLECLNGLTNIGLDITTWGPIIVHLLLQKLDSVTYNEYMEDMKEHRSFPNLQEFTQFLESRFMALENFQDGSNLEQISYSNKHQGSNKTPSNVLPSTSRNNNYYQNYDAPRSSYFNKIQTAAKSHITETRICPICKTAHVLMKCPTFLNMNASMRYETVRELRICKNCLYSHGENVCTSRKSCKQCYKHHHTLMHAAETDQRIISNPSTCIPHAVNKVTHDVK